ncbi:MAG: hypothetical protein HKO76_01660, partial [Acidimicrobiia bacterium]|nr:hypothetical protein [Acidimicrobiia bacterium]
MVNLTAILSDLSGLKATDLDRSARFVDLGFDSLFLTQASLQFRKRFGLRITFRQLFEEAPSIETLADYIDSKLPVETHPGADGRTDLLETSIRSRAARISAVDLYDATSSHPQGASKGGAPSLLERVINEQLKIMEQQLELIRRGEGLPDSEPPSLTGTEVEADRGEPRTALSDPGAGRAKEAADEAASNGGPIPLTEAQQEIWFASQLSPDASCAYNLSNSLHLTGSLDHVILEAAIHELVESHDALRLRIDPLGEQQTIEPSGRATLTIDDLSQLPESDRAAQIEQAREFEVTTPFDLENGPLIRFRLFKLQETAHQLFVTVHHIACDGWSLQLLERRLSFLYSNRKQGRSPDIDWPQFREFAAWLADARQTDAGREDEAYWTEEFATPAPVLEVPLDHSRPPVQTFSCRRLGMDLEDELLTSLRERATEAGMTLFSLLLAAYDILLWRLSGEVDLVVGLFAAGQPAFGADVAGHCVSLLPVRTAISGDETLDAFLLRVRSKLGDAYDHKLLTLGDLIKRLGPARHANRLPLIATTVTMQTPPTGINFHDLAVTVENHNRRASIFDLELYMRELDESLQIDFQFKTELFEESTIRTWMDHYRVVLESMAEQGQTRTADIPVLTAEQWTRYVADRNDTSREYSSLLV